MSTPNTNKSSGDHPKKSGFLGGFILGFLLCGLAFIITGNKGGGRLRNTVTVKPETIKKQSIRIASTAKKTSTRIAQSAREQSGHMINLVKKKEKKDQKQDPQKNSRPVNQDNYIEIPKDYI